MIKELKNKILKVWYRWRVKSSMVHRYRSEYEMNQILEEWITKRIFDGQQGRREELIKMQKRVEETKLFLDFLIGL